MSVEGIKGSNKLSSKELKSPKPHKPKVRKSEGDENPKKTSVVKTDVKSDSVEISIQRTDITDEIVSKAKADSSELSIQEQVKANAEAASEEGKVVNSVDSLEISVKDPELTERIKALVEKIKEDRETLAKRIQAASVLIMKKAYNDNKELIKTAEAILRGEDSGGIETD